MDCWTPWRGCFNFGTESLARKRDYSALFFLLFFVLVVPVVVIVVPVVVIVIVEILFFLPVVVLVVPVVVIVIVIVDLFPGLVVVLVVLFVVLVFVVLVRGLGGIDRRSLGEGPLGHGHQGRVEIFRRGFPVDRDTHVGLLLHLARLMKLLQMLRGRIGDRFARILGDKLRNRQKLGSR